MPITIKEQIYAVPESNFREIVFKSGTTKEAIAKLCVKNCSTSRRFLFERARVLDIELHFYNRTSPIWRLNKQDMQEFLSLCSTYTEALKRLGFGAFGGNYRSLRERILKEGLDVSHFYKNGKKFQTQKQLEDIFVNNEYRNTGILKIGLERLGVSKTCFACGLGTTWQNKPITLQIDHIDGNRLNNTVENLRYLCPNCHTQTETFAGRKRKGYTQITPEIKVLQEKKHSICQCGAFMHQRAKLCMNCEGKRRAEKGRLQRHTTFPHIDILVKMIESSNFVQVAKQLGVSDTTIRKWLKKDGVDPKKLASNKRNSC